jgi:hypothetical protein
MRFNMELRGLMVGAGKNANSGIKLAFATRRGRPRRIRDSESYSAQITSIGAIRARVDVRVANP